MAHHAHRTDCPCCHRHNTVVRRSNAWWAALIGAYVLFSAMVFGASLLGPTIMAVLPMLVATGLGLLPYLHGRVAEPATCTACGRIATGQPVVGSPARPTLATAEVSAA